MKLLNALLILLLAVNSIMWSVYVHSGFMGALWASAILVVALRARSLEAARW